MGSPLTLNRTHPSRERKPKSICLPFPSESYYQACMADRAPCRHYITEMAQHHPELFPQAMAKGFVFQGFISSKKQALRMRRLKLKHTGEVYQIRPSFVLPYMRGRTPEVDKALFLRRWGVSFEGLSYVFGHHPMFWYRAYLSLGRPSVVGTTLKDPQRLPTDVLADEKHTRLGGQRVYVPTTVAQGCILGAEVVKKADTQALSQGYEVFRQEARNLKPDYSPQTVTTDGWQPTQQAWHLLFPLTTLLLCFLHAFLKIKQRCQRDRNLLSELREKIWPLYHAPTLASFAQRIRRLREWAARKKMPAAVKAKVGELWAQAAEFKKAYHHPGAYRTSNALDRLMNYQDRLLYTMQYFHGTQASASLYVRAMALVWNFHPYGLRTLAKEGCGASPFERVNGFRYHDNWLENLLIAASMGGRRE